MGEGLVTFDGSRYSITEKGTSLVNDILKYPDLFSDLLPTLAVIGKRLNEAKIEQLEKTWKNA
jgi:Mn-dependent DtxR family transcriptional regulator